MRYRKYTANAARDVRRYGKTVRSSVLTVSAANIVPMYLGLLRNVASYDYFY